MGVALYPYQEEAIKKLVNGNILCGGVGSGKSRTALAYYHQVVCKGELDPFVPMREAKDLYIITTARKRDTLEWDSELIPFMLKKGAYNENALNLVEVVIDSWNNIGKYKQVTDAFFIFDEQRVVGSGAWVKSFLSISKNNEWLLLTATPGDTWLDYLPVFIANGFYKNRTSFLRRHAVFSPFTKFPKIEKFIDISDLEQCRSSVLVQMNYTTKSHHVRKLISLPFDKETYNDISKRRWSLRDDSPIQEISGLVQELRRVVNLDSSRLAKVAELLDKHDKIIIFYNFNYELEVLRTVKDVSIAEWNGHKHEPIPRSKRWIYLVQYTAGAEGWNCTETDTMIFYSLNYSYKVMTQSAGRIDRLTTKFDTLYYYWFTSDAAIDKAVLSAIKGKKLFNERAFIRNT